MSGKRLCSEAVQPISDGRDPAALQGPSRMGPPLSSAPPAARSVRTPRYRQLADELRAAIASGEAPVDRFPTESVLCRRYRVSRFTVREALRALQGEGLIQRRRGSGTTVRPAAGRPGALRQPLSNIEDILQYARDTRILYQAKGEAALPRRLASELKLSPDEPWVCFQGLRTRVGEAAPIAHTDAYLHGALAAAARHIDLGSGVLFRQMEALTGLRIARVSQDIQAVAATRRLAEALDVPLRSPCLRILRCYLDAEEVVREISVSHHPGDRFAYAMQVEVA